MQTFIAGLAASVAALDDPLVGSSRPKYVAEVQAAILGQRRLIATFSNDTNIADLIALHLRVTQHNLQQPWSSVLQAHEGMLVRNSSR